LRTIVATPRRRLPSSTTLEGSGTPEAISNVVLNAPAPLKVIVEMLVSEALAPVKGFAKVFDALALFPVRDGSEPIDVVAGSATPLEPIALNTTDDPGVLAVDSDPDNFNELERFEYVVSVYVIVRVPLPVLDVSRLSSSWSCGGIESASPNADAELILNPPTFTTPDKSLWTSIEPTPSTVIFPATIDTVPLVAIMFPFWSIVKESPVPSDIVNSWVTAA
jgi:hypothetical protein